MLAALIALSAALSSASAADKESIAARQRSHRTTFTDKDIIDGFLKTTFGAEFHLAGRVDRIRKYEMPVRVSVSGRHTRRKQQLAAIVADIARRVQHLDIAMTADTAVANVDVHLIRDRDFDGTLAKFYGEDRAREIRQSLDPQCLSGFRKNEAFAIQHSDVFLTVDNGDFTFHDCAYEELLQSLGPINDTGSVPWTMFNDDVRMGFFDVYDQYILNILYDPRIKAGMTVAEVEAALPQVLSDVRAWVAKVNGLPAK
ncbi:MAG: DUF2927 domain-containing protein [Xanthobacteraceae bacterium]